MESPIVYVTLPTSKDLLSISPESLTKFQTEKYILAACLTVGLNFARYPIHRLFLISNTVVFQLCVWDWLLAVSDEFEMIRNGKRRLRYFLHGMYFIARICPIILIASSVFLDSATVGTCKVLASLIGIANLVIIPSTSGLLFVRISAVYSRNIYVMALFGTSWLVILGFFVFDSTKSLLRLPDVTQASRCLVAEHKDAWGYIATAAYDTLMYFVMSLRLASLAVMDCWQDQLKSFVTGDGLGWLSKVLLRSGQLYYFMTIGFNICTIIFILSPSVPLEFTSLFLPVNITIASVMACRLHRELALGLFAGTMADGAVSTVVFRKMGVVNQQHSGDSSELRSLDNVDIDTDSDRFWGGWGDKKDLLDDDIELADGARHDF